MLHNGCFRRSNGQNIATGTYEFFVSVLQVSPVSQVWDEEECSKA